MKDHIRRESLDIAHTLQSCKLGYLDHTQLKKERYEIQVDIQDLPCLRTEVINAHSHGVYKGMKYLEHLYVVILVEVSG